MWERGTSLSGSRSDQWLRSGALKIKRFLLAGKIADLSKMLPQWPSLCAKRGCKSKQKVPEIRWLRPKKTPKKHWPTAHPVLSRPNTKQTCSELCGGSANLRIVHPLCFTLPFPIWNYLSHSSTMFPIYSLKPGLVEEKSERDTVLETLACVHLRPCVVSLANPKE